MEDFATYLSRSLAVGAEAFSATTYWESDLVEAAGEQAWFLHCLPAHRGEDVTDDVIDGPRSAVWQQAGNRMDAARAVLAFLVDGQ